MKYLLYCFLVFILYPYSLGAQTYNFRHYSNKDGLSYNTVHCMLQDKKGFMWFGTEDGLNRFDGHSFKVYRHMPYQENSLSDNWITDLFEDSSGRIWINTSGNSCYYDYKSDSFRSFEPLRDLYNIENYGNVREDRSGDLWFVNNSDLIRYREKNNEFKVYPKIGDYNLRLLLNDDGELVVTDSHSIYKYDKSNDRFILVVELPKKGINLNISDVIDVNDFGMLIGTYEEGLKLYDYSTKELTDILPDIYVRDIEPFSKNTYWIGSESGIHIYNIMTKRVVNLQKSLVNEYSISDNAVYCLNKDKEGGMWVGSFFGGINYLPKEYSPFNLFIGGKTHPEMLGNTVREICPDRYGNLWIGTEDNGINRYNLKSGQIVNYSVNNPMHPITESNVHGLFADGDKLWVGGFGRGIDILELPSGRLLKHYSRANTNNGLNTDFVICFCRTRHDEFLIGTADGISIYNKNDDSFSRWKDTRYLVRQIYEDRKGNVWASTTTGIYLYRRDDDKLIHIGEDRNNLGGLGGLNTTSIFEDSKGRIWATTTEGFSVYNEIAGRFEPVNLEKGLPSNLFFRIVEDEEGFFWISTANGLVKFNPETYVAKTFSYKDGLHEAQFNYSSSYRNPEGVIYMGTIDGMISFDPKSFKNDPFNPPLYIENGFTPSKDNLIIYDADNNKKLMLPHDASTFSISYVALSYTSPNAISYAYKLDGIDKDWKDMGHLREVTFANLQPGKYVFKVRSTNSSGVWQENEKALPIIITPPFWATAWAYILYVIIVVVVIVLIYKYKKRKLEEKHAIANQAFENEKEKELYEAKIQFFTFITHEIRTPLTLIKAPLEKILKSGDGNKETHSHLSIIEKNTERLLDLSNQLLDFRKTESRGFKLSFTLTDINLWLSTILQPFYLVMEREGKSFVLNMPDFQIMAYIDREAFSKIITNLMTNAIKYSDSEIALTLEKSDEEHFCIILVNDGFLVPEEEKDKIFSPFYRLKENENKQGSGIGLSLSLSLAEFHFGKLLYTHTPDHRNCFTLALPIMQNSAFGTYQEGGVTPNADAAPESEAPIVSDSKTVVLIVEDQDDMRRFIAKELDSQYLVLQAANGKEALPIIKTNRVNVIVSDIMMPLMDGFELCNIVKNDVEYSHIPFILLTAQHNQQSRLRGLNKGADAYMEKPFSVDVLLAQIDNLIKSREMLFSYFREKPLAEIKSLSVSPVDDIFLKKINEVIDNHLTNEELTVELLSQEMNMSISSLYRKVKGLSGLSPVDFIKIARLKKAVEYMKNGETRINIIAFQVGFSSPAYFSTCFLKQYGSSPSEFLKNLDRN